MPFPSPQGSQAAVHAMLGALTEAGEDAHLLVYGHGAGAAEPAGARYPVHRLPRLPLARSLRSGPSLGKVALDAAMVGRTVRLWKDLGPELVIAHNVEAALVAIAARTPFVYFAHTAMEAELPFYGRTAIAPALSSFLARRHEVAAPYVPLPWARAAAEAPDARAEARKARKALGLGATDAVLLYAGNLDGYQGFEDALAATARLARRLPRAKLLVATESARGPLLRAARGVLSADRLVETGLGDEAARSRAHAAADVALVPRRAPGGLPIKLLDALARGVPVVASRRAAADLAIDRAAIVCRDDDPASMATAAELALSPTAREELARAGPAYIARAHSPERFITALSAVLGEARRRYENR
jgi:glycosyltransferase involved in cell wall biosynthesis